MSKGHIKWRFHLHIHPWPSCRFWTCWCNAAWDPSPGRPSATAGFLLTCRYLEQQNQPRERCSKVLGNKKQQQQQQGIQWICLWKRKKTYTGRELIEKEDTPAFWITALYFLCRAPDTLLCKKWHLPFSSVSSLGQRGRMTKTMLFNMTGQCKRKWALVSHLRRIPHKPD